MRQVHHEPSQADIQQGCAIARRRCLQAIPGNTSVTVVHAVVPKLLQPQDHAARWYRIGALHFGPPHRALTIYLESLSGEVEVGRDRLDLVAALDHQD